MGFRRRPCRNNYPAKTTDRAIYERVMSCDRKRKYKTESEAHRQGKQIYKCRFCDGYHQATSEMEKVAEVVAQAKKRLEVPPQKKQRFQKRRTLAEVIAKAAERRKKRQATQAVPLPSKLFKNSIAILASREIEENGASEF